MLVLSPRLQSDVLHIWLVDLDTVDPGMARVLSTDERERARSIVDPRRRRRWISSRAALRHLIARYVGEEPHALQFTLGTFGKPALGDGPALAFNLSHSDKLAVYVFADTGKVGIDVELTDRRITHEDALRRHLGAEAGTSKHDLLRAWTRREATLKCLGTGIAGPWPPGTLPTVTDVDLDVVDAVCAVASDRGSTGVACWRWDGRSQLAPA